MFVWNIDPTLFHLPDFLGGRGIRYYGVLYALTLKRFGAWMRDRASELTAAVRSPE